MIQSKALREDLTPDEMIAASKKNELDIQKDLISKFKNVEQRHFYLSRIKSLCRSPKPKLINKPLDKKNGWTPLMLAVLYQVYLKDLQEELGEPPYLFLIKQGADINASNRFMMTPLMMTAFTKEVTVASTLIQQGAEINMCNYHDETVLHLAYQEGNFSSKENCDPRAKVLLQTLINAGADINLRSYTKLCLSDKEIQSVLTKQGIFLKKTFKKPFWNVLSQDKSNI